MQTPKYNVAAAGRREPVKESRSTGVQFNLSDAPKPAVEGTQPPAATAPQPPAPAPQATPPAPEGGQPKDERLDALERREKALHRQHQLLKQEKEEWNRKQEETRLRESGRLTEQEWADRHLEKESLSPEQQKIQLLEDKLARLEGHVTESHEQAYEAAQKQVRAEVATAVDSGEFPLVQATGSQGEVAEFIEKVYESEGYVMTAQEAAREIEGYWESRMDEILKLDKIRQKLQPAAPEEGAPQQTQAEPSKTLTPDMHGASRPLTRIERAKLIAAGRQNEIPGYNKG